MMKWIMRKVKKRKIKSKVKPKKFKTPSLIPKKTQVVMNNQAQMKKNKREMIGKQKGGKAAKPGKPSVSDFDAIPTIAKKGIVTCPEAQWTMLMEYVQ